MIFPYYAKLLFPKPLIKYNSFIKAHSSEKKKEKKEGVFPLWWLPGVTEDGGPRRALLHEAGGAPAAGTSTLPASKGHVGGLGEEQDAGGPPKMRKNKSKKVFSSWSGRN